MRRVDRRALLDEGGEALLRVHRVEQLAELARLGLERARRHVQEPLCDRQSTRALLCERVRDLEFAWATFLARAMEQGAIPEGDPRLLTRAILGLYNSIWHWYRPSGSVALKRAAEFFIARILAILGVSPGAAESILAAA